MDLQLVFTSTTGRSGTGYLTNIINTNAKNASAEHDPYPRGYGNPIRWYDNFETEKLKKLVQKKIIRLKRRKRYEKLLFLPFMRTPRRVRNYISSCVSLVEIKEIYLESTHAFIKSFAEEMYNLNPELSIIHLTRNPLKVAKSFFNRNSIPDAHNIYLLDPQFKRNELKITSSMSDFQKCLWYWFETELRHVKFLENHDVRKVIDIDIEDLNDMESVCNMFEFLGITYEKLNLEVDKNKNIEITSISDQDITEAKDFIDTMPDWVFDKIGDKYHIRDNLIDK